MTYSNVAMQTYSANQTLILKELEATLAQVSEVEIAAAQRMILAARRVFVSGAGRPGRSRSGSVARIKSALVCLARSIMASNTIAFSGLAIWLGTFVKSGSGVA